MTKTTKMINDSEIGQFSISPRCSRYEIGDRVRLCKPHSEGEHATLLGYAVQPIAGLKYGVAYRIYIPYWDYFTITDEDIIEKVDHIDLEAAEHKEMVV